MLFLTFAFVGGCEYRKKTFDCPVITSDTILVKDTIIHTIVDSFPYYIVKNDTIIYTDTVFKDIDTAKILSDYFAIHIYTRTWTDSLVDISLRDYITQNMPVKNNLTYRILRPQEVIVNNVDQSVHYSSYLYFGGTVPIKDVRYSDFTVSFAFKQGLCGIGYNPYLKSLSVTGAIKIAQFKK